MLEGRNDVLRSDDGYEPARRLDHLMAIDWPFVGSANGHKNAEFGFKLFANSVISLLINGIKKQIDELNNYLIGFIVE